MSDPTSPDTQPLAPGQSGLDAETPLTAPVVIPISGVPEENAAPPELAWSGAAAPAPPPFDLPSPPMAAPPAFGLKLPRLSNTLSWPRIAEAPQIARGLFNQTAEQIWTAHMTELEVWAEANRKDARRDAFAFWALKAPAIVASASAGVWAHYQWTTVSLMAGAIASFCVIVDGIQPRGMLRNTHLRAFHDLRILMSHMTSRLRASSGEPEAIVRAIIGESESERERIADYIRDAETALKYSDKI